MTQKASLLFTEVLSNRSINRKCLGIARNYFTSEIQNNSKNLILPPYPYIFSKTLSALCPKGKNFTIPRYAKKGAIEHQVELGIMIHRYIKNFREEDYLKEIGAYFLVIDYTNQEMTNEAKKKGQPWFLSKAQDNFLFLSDYIPVENIKDPHNLELELKVNGETKQKDNTKNMFFKIQDQLKYISSYITLEPGDILMTGSPEGFGAVEEGDLVEATMKQDGKVIMEIKDTIQREK